MNGLDIGFTWNSKCLPTLQPASEPKKIPYVVKKMMAEYVWDITAVEDNPFSFLEVQTLLDGQTVGGHKLSDQQQVINQKNALMFLLDSLNEDRVLDKEFVLAAHEEVAKGEALSWGQFRSGQVGIGGTSHTPPASDLLDAVFATGFSQILAISDPVERALAYYFWGSLNQFFYDGNKRTSRLIMNYILMSAGYYYLTIPGAQKEAFNQMMVDFYDLKDASEGIKFMRACYRNWD